MRDNTTGVPFNELQIHALHTAQPQDARDLMCPCLNAPYCRAEHNILCSLPSWKGTCTEGTSEDVHGSLLLWCKSLA